LFLVLNSNLGINAVVSTAFGITETLWWLTRARNTVFSFLKEITLYCILYFYKLTNNKIIIYPICDTQIQWLQSANDISKNLFVMIADVSANPKREWSVNTVYKQYLCIYKYMNIIYKYIISYWIVYINITRIPSKRPIIIVSWAKVENAECPCIIVICSLTNTYLINGKEETIEGKTHWL
jgi:hypothetical protein